MQLFIDLKRVFDSVEFLFAGLRALLPNSLVVEPAGTRTPIMW